MAGTSRRTFLYSTESREHPDAIGHYRDNCCNIPITLIDL
jgi:hypothetical protein